MTKSSTEENNIKEKYKGILSKNTLRRRCLTMHASFLVGTRRQNEIKTTLFYRHGVVSTFIQRRSNVVIRLGHIGCELNGRSLLLPKANIYAL